MRDLVYYVASSLDGFIAGPEGEFDFFPFEGGLKAYVTSTYPETLPTPYRAAVGLDVPNARFDTAIMGRGTYEPGLREGFTSPYAHLRQYVFSRTLPAAPDPEVTVLADDPLPFVRELKRQEGQDIWLCGGGTLAAELLPEIDELCVKLNPVVVGAGIPLFTRSFEPWRFTITETRPFDTGVVLLRYRRTS
ncbi:dihydrofolate reductase family protein [Plantactinospora sp. GCM10030261]|uniref:dihydrofolate reductase family protein n=1 Tax=Plantactinospora sp. GCM10030261 TaxID=3273420 RepID=UPI00360D9D00